MLRLAIMLFPVGDASSHSPAAASAVALSGCFRVDPSVLVARGCRLRMLL
jgi:hypothetical protein